MTLGMRVRMWARTAPRSHVVVTVLAVYVLVAGLVAMSLPTKEKSTGVAAGGFNAADGGSIVDGGSPGTDVTSAGGAGASGTAPVEAEPGTPVSGSGPLTGQRASAGSAGAAQGAPGPQSRTASDRGVTADSIKIGFLIMQLGGLDATGFAVGFRQDQQQAIKAFVDHANAQGGVNGRKITYVTAKSDPLNASSMRQACLKMTQDEKVFSVLDSGGVLGVALECFAQNKTPHVGGAAQTVDEDLYRRGGGYEVSSAPSGTRLLQNWVEFAFEAGEIGPGKGKLGILSDECTPDPKMFDKEFKPLLRARGVDFYDVRVSCDYTAAQQQVPGAVLQMRQQGVSRVFLGVFFPTAQTFIQNAKTQGWHPKYSVSDFWGLNADTSAKNFDADAFDGTRSFTFTHNGEEAAHIPYSPAVQECSKILSDAGLQPITAQQGTDTEVLHFCGSLQLWLLAMRRTPVNPTRADWVAALQTLGDAYTTTFSQRAVYGPGKFNAGDSYATTEWRRACSCWVQIAPHRPARA